MAQTCTGGKKAGANGRPQASTRDRWRFLLGSLICLGLALSSILGATGVDLRTAQFMGEVRDGFSQLYNLDYKPAEATFAALRSKYPEHPAPPLYLATAIWLRELFERQELDLDNFIAPSYFDKPTDRKMPESERRRFDDLVNESLEKSQKILALDAGNKDARYFQGSAHGILGSFAITIDRSRTNAFREGKQAYQIHNSIVEEDATYYDAFMSVGVYEYIVGNLPWYIKWLAAIVGYRGSVERGFEYLALAATKGQFVADDARTLQMVLFVREGRYAEALANVRFLRQRAPKNFILHLNEAQILEKMKRPKEAAAIYAELLAKAEQGVPNFDRLPLETMRFRIGWKILNLGDSEKALVQFQHALRDPKTPERERVLSRLSEGKALDLLGRREDALSSYRSVLSSKDVEGSRAEAEKWIRTPFSDR